MSTDHLDDEPEEVCGESYDHRLELVDEDDGMSVYWCKTCGAEIIEAPDA